MTRKIEHPYRGLTGGSWLRGNLHTHTTRSDGTRKPQRVINDYAARGYDFLAITDHDLTATAAEYRKLNHKGMVLINGNEVSANGSHIVHVGADKYAPPLPQRQLVIDRINQGNGLAVIAHPNWKPEFDYTKIGQLREWVGYHGLEIFNGVIGRLQGTHYGANKWDQMLSQGRLLWGFANDDSHIDADAEQGWNMVYTKQRTAKAILQALHAGKFYASSGVTITNIKVTGSKIRLETQNASRIVAVTNDGTRVGTSDAPAIEIDFPENQKFTYLRFECFGDGEKMAWTQPFWVSLNGKSALAKI